MACVTHTHTYILMNLKKSMVDVEENLPICIIKSHHFIKHLHCKHDNVVSAKTSVQRKVLAADSSAH